MGASFTRQPIRPPPEVHAGGLMVAFGRGACCHWASARRCVGDQAPSPSSVQLGAAGPAVLSAHGQVSGLATSGPTGRRHGGLRHGDASPLATSVMSAGRSGGFGTGPDAASGSGTASHQRLAATAGRRAVTASEPTLPPSFVQRSAWRRISARARSAAGRAGCPPAIMRNVVRGTSSDAHLAPQRQHASSWPAIGARQERHRRGTWRWRIAQLVPESRSPVGASACSIEGRLFRR